MPIILAGCLRDFPVCATFFDIELFKAPGAVLSPQEINRSTLGPLEQLPAVTRGSSDFVTFMSLPH